MARIDIRLEPRPARTALFAEPCARLVDEPAARSRLPVPVAARARDRLRLPSGEAAHRDASG
ncbi:hypothetical protein [Streptomyces sp. HGB0020]|uniref:hypothetical protein n=1 Tax=Streptomyces sp. HGB0020 TaxID=1078086 RepID=UPI00039B2C51|nr:hypothetical protein [Streptomyces sp. HGB0020]